MKFINLDGLTTAERLVVLENICNDIIAHLNKETLYTTVVEYSPSILKYNIIDLYPKINVTPESGQLVYFSNGYVGIIGNIDTIDNTYGVSEVTSIKGEKGDNALEYSGIYETGNFPVKGDLISDNNLSNYSRTPKSGDKIIICGFTNTTPKRSFMCLCTRTPDTDIAWSVNNVVETTGEKGNKGDKGDPGDYLQLYCHIIHFSQTEAASGATIVCARRGDAYTLRSLNGDLKKFGCTTPSTYYPANGIYSGSGAQGNIFGIFASGSNVACQYTNGTATLDTISDNVFPFD